MLFRAVAAQKTRNLRQEINLFPVLVSVFKSSFLKDAVKRHCRGVPWRPLNRSTDNSSARLYVQIFAGPIL